VFSFRISAPWKSSGSDSHADLYEWLTDHVLKINLNLGSRFESWITPNPFYIGSYEEIFASYAGTFRISFKTLLITKEFAFKIQHHVCSSKDTSFRGAQYFNHSKIDAGGSLWTYYNGKRYSNRTSRFKKQLKATQPVRSEYEFHNNRRPRGTIRAHRSA
jgi:hypothetical protein